MKVVFVRCGRTTDGETPARAAAADQQPLSPEGRRAVREAAQGLASVLRAVTLVASSPLIAAVETAAIFAKAFGLRATELAQLDPAARPGELRRWLSRQPADSAALLVGHEPAISRLAAALLSGGGRFISLKPAGACLLELSTAARQPRARLHWVLTPAQLRRFAKTSGK